MAFAIPSPRPVSSNPFWADDWMYCAAARRAWQNDWNAKGAAFEAGSLSQSDWEAYQSAWFDNDMQIQVLMVGILPPDDLVAQVPLTF